MEQNNKSEFSSVTQNTDHPSYEGMVMDHATLIAKLEERSNNFTTKYDLEKFRGEISEMLDKRLSRTESIFKWCILLVATMIAACIVPFVTAIIKLL